MSAILLPNRSRKQPQQRLGIAPGPLSDGLAAACVPGLPEFLQGELPVVSGGFSQSVGREGICALGPSAQIPGYVEYTLKNLAPITGDYAFLIVASAATNSVGLFTHTFVRTGSLGISGFSVSSGSVIAQIDNNNTPTISSDNTQPAVFLAQRVSNRAHIWRNGVSGGDNVTGTRTGAISSLIFGRDKSSNNSTQTVSYLFLLWNRSLSNTEAREISGNPWQVFRAPPRRLWAVEPIGGGEVNGSVAYTNADDTSSATAAPVVTASSATTNADDVSDAVAEAEAETVTATVDVTNADDISAVTAKPIIVGASATTNANDVSSANATPTVTASAANTNADDISAASATSGSDVEGSVAYTNIDDVSNAVAVPTVTASSASVNADDNSAATLKATITATVSVTNSNDISSASSGAVVDGSVAVTNADDVSVGSASPVVSLSSATTNADDISDAVAVAEAGEIVASVDVINADDVSSAVAAPVITASIAYSNLHDLSAAIAEINFGTIVEALMTTGIIQDTRIKKPGIPSDAPEWQRTMFEIFTGRRGNKIDVAKFQTLTFSATPTQAECEALYSYLNEVRQSMDQLVKRFDS